MQVSTHIYTYDKVGIPLSQTLRRLFGKRAEVLIQLLHEPQDESVWEEILKERGFDEDSLAQVIFLSLCIPEGWRLEEGIIPGVEQLVYYNLNGHHLLDCYTNIKNLPLLVEKDEVFLMI